MDRNPNGTYSTGVRQEVTPQRQHSSAERLERESQTALRMERHYWTVLVVHHASEGLLDGFDQDVLEKRLLDADTMLGPPVLVCFNCELEYHPQLRHRKCRPVPVT